MADQITLEEALELVEFDPLPEGWRVKHVNGDVCGSVNGDVWENVYGNVCGDVRRDVWGNVCGNVRRNVQGNVQGNVGGAVCVDVQGNVWGNVGGTINGRQWKFIETPKEKLKRLIEEGADKAQLLEAFNQLEDN